MQAINNMAKKGQLRAKVLLAMSQLPFDVSQDAFSNALRTEALQDIRQVHRDAALYELATADKSADLSLDLLCDTFVR